MHGSLLDGDGMRLMLESFKALMWFKMAGVKSG